jgi:hypothetical protein
VSESTVFDSVDGVSEGKVETVDGSEAKVDDAVTGSETDSGKEASDEEAKGWEIPSVFEGDESRA